jgi:hypothetical protein
MLKVTWRCQNSHCSFGIQLGGHLDRAAYQAFKGYGIRCDAKLDGFLSFDTQDRFWVIEVLNPMSHTSVMQTCQSQHTCQ